MGLLRLVVATLKTLGVMALALGGATVCVVSLTIVAEVLSAKYEQDIRMSFEQFQTIYEMAPSKWVLCDRTALYQTYRVYFGAIGQLRYWLWKAKCEKDKEKRRKFEVEAKILSDIKADIEDFLRNDGGMR